MSILKDFREFAVKGNAVDLAVGVVIGAAFGKIVGSFVSDIIMPAMTYLIAGVKVTEIKWVLKEAVLDAQGKIVTEAVSVNFGNFAQTLLDFLIIAFSIFIAVKGVNLLRRKAPPPPPAPVETRQEKLLGEIRDLLKEKK